MACRAGSTEAHYGMASGLKLDDIAWYSKNSEGSTHAVALKEANNWGFTILWKMSGNGHLMETSVHKRAVTNSRGSEDSNTYTVLRGGSWDFFQDRPRSAPRRLARSRWPQRPLRLPASSSVAAKRSQRDSPVRSREAVEKANERN